jgi:hypothetical protein
MSVRIKIARRPQWVCQIKSGAMPKQSIIAHADAKAARNRPEHHGHSKCLPGKEEQSGDSADVKCAYEEARCPVNGLSKGFVTSKNTHDPFVLRNYCATN